MGIDSLVLAFRLLNRKKVTVAQLREDILQQTEVPVKLLQKLTGKIGSFVLAVPAARLFCREMFSAIVEAEKQGRMVKIEGTVRKVLEYWRFLDTWEGHIPWKPEKHEVVELSSDASGFRWAGVVSSDKDMTQCSDYWEQHETPEHISVKETRALPRTLISVKDRVQNKRVDAKVDNQNLIKAWENQGGKSKALNRAIKELWETSVQLNIDLNLHYVPSRDNIADKPSRQCSPSDAKLMPRTLLVAGPGQARGEGAKGSSSRRVGTTVPNQETGVDAETNEMGPLGFPDSASMFQGAARVWVPAVNCSECSDEAIFKALFFAGDRVSGLMRCRTDEVGRLPEGHILVEPPSTSAVDNAFRRYLEKAGLYEGETLHGCRAGCAISLHMAGASDDSVMNHIEEGWNSKGREYEVARIRKRNGVARRSHYAKGFREEGKEKPGGEEKSLNLPPALWIHVEHGLVTIDTTTTLAEVHKLKEDHLRRPPRNYNNTDGQAGHGHATSAERLGDSKPTRAFSTDHLAASGTLHVHACKFCSRHRPGVDAGHPAKFCPYNKDRGRQGSHAAARETLA
ncbi:hypothetical protein Bbelb_377710 [Branchiostoma belcheri]|nr:hypothetical protein Bbelb_377710 [Branchiostoma belcheri]